MRQELLHTVNTRNTYSVLVNKLPVCVSVIHMSTSRYQSWSHAVHWCVCQTQNNRQFQLQERSVFGSWGPCQDHSWQIMYLIPFSDLDISFFQSVHFRGMGVGFVDWVRPRNRWQTVRWPVLRYVILDPWFKLHAMILGSYNYATSCFTL